MALKRRRNASINKKATLPGIKGRPPKNIDI